MPPKSQNANPPHPNKPLGTRLMRFLVTILIAYLIALVAIRLFESHFLFFPNYPGRLEGDWHPRNLPIQDIWLTSSDSTRLHAWWIPNDQAKFTFLAFHGNASNIANRAPTYEFLHATPANVFALEYRGYGRSDGTPSEPALYKDADAAYQLLVNTKSIDPRTIISYGQSLGTAVAASVAAHHQVAAVILEAPFPSASALARKLFWFFPGIELLVHGQLTTTASLNKSSAPILIVHCTQDPVIPFQFGQAVYNAAPSPKQFLPIEAQCHEESSLIAPGKYRATLQAFLSTLDRSARQPTHMSSGLSSVHLNPLQSADPQNAPITPLQSADPKTKHLKSFRIRTYEKGGGGGQTVNQLIPRPYL